MKHTLRSNNYNSSCTGSIWAGKLYSLDWIHFCYNNTITEQNVAFLVPDSCRATERNGKNIRADVTDAIFQNVQNDASSAIFRRFCNCFRLFDIAGKSQYTYIVGKYKLIGKRLSFLNVSKARANKLYIFRQCRYIVLLCICLYISKFIFFRICKLC